MQFLKGLATVSGTVLALLIATMAFFVLQMLSGPSHPPGTLVGWDIRSLWVSTVYSPVYWLVVLVLMGMCVWVFKRWVFSH